MMACHSTTLSAAVRRPTPQLPLARRSGLARGGGHSSSASNTTTVLSRKEFLRWTRTRTTMTTRSTTRTMTASASASASALPLTDASSVMALLATCAAGAKLAEEHTRWGAATSAPLVAMATAMALGVLGILPASSPAYDAVWTHLMPLAVVLSLLSTNLRDVVKQSGVVLAAFCVGSVGSVIGTAVAFVLVGPSLGPEAWKMAACLCASYVGGSLNYAATAQALGLSATPAGQAALAAGMAADNLAMAGFLAILMAIPASPPKAKRVDEILRVSSEEKKYTSLGASAAGAGGAGAAGAGAAGAGAGVASEVLATGAGATHGGCAIAAHSMDTHAEAAGAAAKSSTVGGGGCEAGAARVVGGGGPTVATMVTALAAALVVLEVGTRVAAAAGLAGGALGLSSLLAPFVSAAAAAVKKTQPSRSRAGAAGAGAGAGEGEGEGTGARGGRGSRGSGGGGGAGGGGEDADEGEEEEAEEQAAAAAEGDATSVRAFSGGASLGGALMLLFFSALGACADPRVALTAGAPTLVFIAAQLCVHLACCLVVGTRLLGLPTWAVLTASNANVGGPATAAAMAAARGWSAAVQPAVVTGTLGYVVGTPLGCAVGQALRSLALF